MLNRLRLSAALRAAVLHLGGSCGMALLAAALVFGVWYPFPFRELSGGRELFLLLVSVDVICGPLLTLVLFNPTKPRIELWRDLGLVAVLQFAALGYGLHTVWLARPVYLVQEIDRFKAVTSIDLDTAALAALPAVMQPSWHSGPVVVAIRAPKNNEERHKVLFESVQGGRDYAERPEFYLPYEGDAALKSLQRAKPLTAFLQKYPGQEVAALALAKEKMGSIAQWQYLPVVARQDWIAVLDDKGMVMGFLKGDGF